MVGRVIRWEILRRQDPGIAIPGLWRPAEPGGAPPAVVLPGRWFPISLKGQRVHVVHPFNQALSRCFNSC
jgi:hypothetical protein